MPTPPRPDSLGKLLQVYQETWQPDHDEVKRSLWAFEDGLAGGLALFKAIHDRYWTWRDRVITGQEEFDADQEQDIKGRFIRWLEPCKGVLGRLQALEAQYNVVEGGREFRRCCDEARQILLSWESPQLNPRSDSPELIGVSAHTTRALTVEQLAEELARVSRPAIQESVPLRHRVDESQVF